MGLTVEAGLVCFSRVYVGAHYSLDILGGITLGIAISLVFIAFANNIEIDAVDESKVKADNDQSNDQNNDCDNGSDCDNSNDNNVDIDAENEDEVEVETDQDSEQDNDCDNGGGCSNSGSNSVNIG